MSFAVGQIGQSGRGSRYNRNIFSEDSDYSFEQQVQIRAEIALAVDGVEHKAFLTERAAAVALHKALDPISTKYDIEIGAFIHAGQDKFAGQFVVGDVATQYLKNTVSITPLRGFKVTASFHTHGNWSASHVGADLQRDVAGGYNGYVSGAGEMLRFDYGTRTYDWYTNARGWHERYYP